MEYDASLYYAVGDRCFDYALKCAHEVTRLSERGSLVPRDHSFLSLNSKQFAAY